MKIGYARVSTVGQNLEAQLELLVGCDKIYQEKRSGTTTNGRDELERAIDQLRAGDVLVVTRLDRLARSLSDLFGILQRITDAGAAFTCLQQGGVDTSTSTGKLMVGILGAVAEFETDLRKERQLEGIRKAHANGTYKGGKKRVDRRLLAQLRTAGQRPHEIVKAMGITRATYYRIAKELDTELREAADADRGFSDLRLVQA